MDLRIDLNSDVGERPGALADGSEVSLIRLVTSVNIACGGHAGDEATMKRIVLFAHEQRVSIGAHPSYPDRENFGRVRLDLTPAEITRAVREQIAALAAVAERCGTRVRHVKPHGALYNTAANDRIVAEAIAAAVLDFDGSLTLVGLAGSLMLEVWKQEGLAVAAEAFADRRYESDGSLRLRRFADALIADPAAAAEQALDIAVGRRVTAWDGTPVSVEADTVCVHGDTPGSLQIAVALRRRLETAGVRLAGLGRQSLPTLPPD